MGIRTSGVLFCGRNAVLRDAVVDRLRAAGLDVSMDSEWGQRVLDEANERGEHTPFMGSRVKKRMSEINQYYSNKLLTSEEKSVVDVFSGNTDRFSLNIVTENGTIKFELQQGNENHAGAKHSIFRHYNTQTGYYTVDEIVLIPDIVKTGIRTEEGRYVVYAKTFNGIRYKVVTEIKGNKNRVVSWSTWRELKRRTLSPLF